ncbi:MAG: AmmeMemoRadiSam system protein B [Pirellulales bacterium]|nr:AmmeMemoRadiSam system protein B [Pirellulales bacterium]
MKSLSVLIVSVVLICMAIPLHAQEARPILNQSSYCWDGPRMDQFVEYLKEHTAKTPDDLPPLVAGISPHVDYRDGGRAYYPLFQKISAPEVVLFGVTHRKTREKLGQPQDKLIFDTHADWQGPYSKIRVSPLRGYLQKRLGPKVCMTSDEAHRMDHSIEGLLPFLQHAQKDVRITPILVTAMPFDKMDAVSTQLADALAAYMKENNLTLGKDLFILISADANHYGKDFSNLHFGEGAAAHRKAVAHDRQLVETYLEGPITTAKLRGLSKKLWGQHFKDYGEVVWCGQYTIPFGLLTVDHLVAKLSPGKRLTGRPFLYGDSYTDSRSPLKVPGLGPTSARTLGHWVGYFSAGYYLAE